MLVRQLMYPLRTRLLYPKRVSSQQIRKIAGSAVRHSDDDPFKYTSGRWIYNEHLRQKERYHKFNIPALKSVISDSLSRPASDIISFTKFSEGGFNRLFQATFNDGKSVIARLPYPSTVPKHYAVASDVATMDYLRSHGIPTPKIHAWCSTDRNPVEAEYIIMEKVDGMPLGEIWYRMTAEEIYQILKQVVEMETKYMSLEFPACGSLYYQKDLPSEKTVPLSDSNGAFCVGPSAHYTWWQGERTQLDVDRGPWTSPNDIYTAVGKRELTWTKKHAKPRLHYERLYREIHNFAQMHPDTHIQALTDYLALTPYLGFKPGSQLHRPVLRHLDLQPNNILISEDREVVGLIDWQHSSILPLSMVAGIPKHIQNYGDPESDSLVQPALDLASDIDSMPMDEQGPIRETFRKRLVHFFYAEFTRLLNGGHLYAIFDSGVILHQKLLESAGTPWEGDSISLQADIIRTLQQWSRLPGSSESPPPITYSDEVIKKVLDLDAEQKEVDSAMEYMRNGIGVDIMGWVQNEEYEAAKEKSRQIKEKTIELAETEQDVITARDHFPFDDFDEDS